MAPLAHRVEEAGVAAIQRRRDPSRVLPVDFFRDCDRLRELFATLVGARDPQRVAILPAVSYGIAVVARNLAPKTGQNVVIVEEQFPSNVYAWRTLSRHRGLDLRTVARPKDGPPCAEEWNARVLEAIDADTAIVALPNVHWTDGSLFDLRRIGEEARSHGAALIIDGSQSVGALPLDVEEVRPDALICAGYKWLFGPYSVALGYFSERFDDGAPLEETWIARRGSEDFQGLVQYNDSYQPGALRYDVGERSNFTLVPMMVSALEMVLEWQPVRVQAYCRSLLEGFMTRMDALGLSVEADGWRGEHMLGVRLPEGLALESLQEQLTEAGVFASLRGDALRVSAHVYNDVSDVEALAEVLEATVLAPATR
jgi:selenocysteine lyase/cysteine desulfurase